MNRSIDQWKEGIETEGGEGGERGRGEGGKENEPEKKGDEACVGVKADRAYGAERSALRMEG